MEEPIYFTISLDPNVTNIDSVGLPEGLKQTYIDAFSLLTTNPFAIDESLALFEDYYFAQAEAVAATAVSSSTNVSSSVASLSNNVVQLDMNGSIQASNNQAVFSRTKDEAKNILGSVDKVAGNDILIADSINKRAIIVDTISKRVKWEYKSDRYVIDAHMISNNPTIKINNSNFKSEDIYINVGKVVIWENNMPYPIAIYSGDISSLDDKTDFREELYGTIFKSYELQTGDRFCYKFDSELEINWFSYPNFFEGKIVASNNRISSTDQFIILEADGLESPFTGRVIQIDCWGNILRTFGHEYLVKPRDAIPLLDRKVIIST